MRAITANNDGGFTDVADTRNGYFRDCLSVTKGCKERRKALAMLHLHDVCDWNTEEIGQLFGQNRGQIHRILHRTRASLRAATEVDSRIQIEKQAGHIAGEFADGHPSD